VKKKNKLQLQAYVIATSTKINLTGTIDAKFDDKYFKAPAQKKKTQEELVASSKQVMNNFLAFCEFLNNTKNTQTKAVVAASRVADQKEVDKLVIESVKKVPYLKAYLNASFTLTKGQFPHELKF